MPRTRLILISTTIVLFGLTNNCITPQKPSFPFELNNRISELKNSELAYLIFASDTTCYQEFDYLGFMPIYKDSARHYVGVTTDFGNSCKRNTKILVFSNLNEFVGFYQTPQVLPDTIVEGSAFVGTFENGEFFGVNIRDTFELTGEPIILQKVR